MNTSLTLGRVIAARRAALGLSLKDLGRLVHKEDGHGVSAQYLHDIERDRRTPSTQVLGERANHVKLIRGGCRIAVATDNAPSALPELAGSRASTPFFADPGIGTILAIEGLVGLGMTAGEALVAATKTGAWAAGKLDQFGTIEVGKLADILLLDRDPLANIVNIRSLRWVMKEGRMIDPATLPVEPKYYRR